MEAVKQVPNQLHEIMKKPVDTGSCGNPPHAERRLSGAGLPITAKRPLAFTTPTIVVRPREPLPPLPWRPLGTHQAPIHLALPAPPRRGTCLRVIEAERCQPSDKLLFHEPSYKTTNPFTRKGFIYTPSKSVHQAIWMTVCMMVLSVEMVLAFAW
ncbi:hypothetical protein D3C80_1714410 [compost metagenome]